ncbi:hypothetical protein SAMN06265340_11424 [Desulfurobacterium atlanticum]|uniref:Uncharacterized protein n=1 Tax=Desulfurobacterium atlanticum TaxID=240169 RepID=A0A239A181_9BACT|nr:hypothetical protein SAMN06265340_11424 [Desulfurobacterium atlanticum]
MREQIFNYIFLFLIAVFLINIFIWVPVTLYKKFKGKK